MRPARPPVVVAPLDYPKGPQLPPRRAPHVDAAMFMVRPLPARYFVVRLKRDGPLVPARLWWCAYEPGVPANLLDRGRLSIYPRADIAGDEVPPEQLLDERLWPDLTPMQAPTHWKYAQIISKGEYDYQLAHLRWSERNAPHDPALHPRRPVDPHQMRLPDFTREHEQLRGEPRPALVRHGAVDPGRVGSGEAGQGVALQSETGEITNGT